MFTNYKVFLYLNLPEFIRQEIKEEMNSKFREYNFLIQPVGELIDDFVDLYGEKLTEKNSPYYLSQKWFINQGCKNEDVLILLTNLH